MPVKKETPQGQNNDQGQVPVPVPSGTSSAPSGKYVDFELLPGYGNRVSIHQSLLKDKKSVESDSPKITSAPEPRNVVESGHKYNGEGWGNDKDLEDGFY